MNLRKVLNDCYHFVMQRKKQEGGFAATPLMPVTVEDTYHALKIIKALQELGLDIDYKPDDDKVLKSWLYQNNKKKWEEPKVFYHFLRTLQMAGFTIDKAQIKQYIVSFEGMIGLERYFYLAKLSEVAETSLSRINKSFKCEIVKDWWMFLYLSEKGFLNSKIRKSEIAEYFIKCQNPDGGFGFSPGTTSYIDNTYFCLKALYFLGYKPEDLDKAIEFILFCQTKAGGFARTPQAAAFMDSTFYAVEGLRILKQWRCHCEEPERRSNLTRRVIPRRSRGISSSLCPVTDAVRDCFGTSSPSQ